MSDRTVSFSAAELERLYAKPASAAEDRYTKALEDKIRSLCNENSALVNRAAELRGGAVIRDILLAILFVTLLLVASH
jgi:hypothetical protein